MGIAIFVPGVSFADNNLGKVTIKENDVPVTGISIVGESEVKNENNSAKYDVYYTPSNTSQKGVSWSIVSGSEFAAIDQSGRISVVGDGDVTIKATSKVNPNITAEKNIHVETSDTVWYYNTLDADQGRTNISADILVSDGNLDIVGKKINILKVNARGAGTISVYDGETLIKSFDVVEGINTLRFDEHIVEGIVGIGKVSSAGLIGFNNDVVGSTLLLSTNSGKSYNPFQTDKQAVYAIGYEK
ncbi:MAG: Ig-like domain-containing protein [Prevotellaceae bacterium]|nr:Ig-like domain-containing protein [Prevotellaceae bacterium]